MGTRENRLREPTIYVLSRNIKKYQLFLSEFFQFLEVKFSIYLNRRDLMAPRHNPMLPLKMWKNRIPLKSVPGGVYSLANYTIVYEET